MKEGYTTIQVSAENSEKIKDYCERKRRSKGEFVDAVWEYLEEFLITDDIEIFNPGTPFIPTKKVSPADGEPQQNQQNQQNPQQLTVAPAIAEEQNAAFIAALQSIVQSVDPARLIGHGEQYGRMQEQCKAMEADKQRMESEVQNLQNRVDELTKMLKESQEQTKMAFEIIKPLQRYKQSARAEFQRIRENNKLFGKIEIYEPE